MFRLMSLIRYTRLLQGSVVFSRLAYLKSFRIKLKIHNLINLKRMKHRILTVITPGGVRTGINSLTVTQKLES